MKAGDPVSVIVGGVRNTRACWYAKYFIAARVGLAAYSQYRPVALLPETEGIAWAQGHDGPAVDALKVVAAIGTP